MLMLMHDDAESLLICADADADADADGDADGDAGQLSTIIATRCRHIISKFQAGTPKN